MMHYTSFKLRPKHFLSFTGLKVEEFDRLVLDIRNDWVEQRLNRLENNNPNRLRKIGGGRKQIIDTLEDQLLLTLLWTKLYSSYLLLEYLFGVYESTAFRIIQKTLLLPQDRFVFQDPRKSGRKKITTLEELRKLIPDLDDILMDATEQPIPRPEKKRKRVKYHSGKKKRFTLKTQIATAKQGFILHPSRASPGRQHDYKVFKASILPQIIPKGSRLYGDSGYQGIQKDFPELHSVIPFKRTRSHKKLTRSEQIQNTKQRKIRIRVEHAFSRLKKYRVLSETYRHSLQNYDTTFRFVANIVNFRMLQRVQAA